MTAMTFDGGPPQLALQTGGPSSLICVGSSAPSGESWNPYTHSTGDFFLPSGKLSSRREADGVGPGAPQRSISDGSTTTPPEQAQAAGKRAGSMMASMIDKMSDKVREAPKSELHRSLSAERRTTIGSIKQQPQQASSLGSKQHSAASADAKKNSVVIRPASGDRQPATSGSLGVPSGVGRNSILYPNSSTPQGSFTTPRVLNRQR